jgi:hypothetical protein
MRSSRGKPHRATVIFGKPFDPKKKALRAD